MLLLLSSLTASAQTLEWRWSEGQVHTWALDSVLVFAEPHPLQARLNQEGRVRRLQTELVWTCRVGVEDRSGWELACHIDDVRLMGWPLAGEEEAVETALIELDSALTGATAQLQLTRRGHLRGVDLEGVSKAGGREAAIHETLRGVVARAAAGFDLHLPGEGPIPEGWRQKTDQRFAVPVSTASQASVRVEHRTGEVGPGRVSGFSTGTGTVRYGADPQGEQAVLLAVEAESRWVFEGQAGHLVRREWVVVGRETASSRFEVGSPVEPYAQAGVIQHLDPTDRPTPGAASGLWTVDTLPSEAWHLLVSSALRTAPGER